MLQDKFQLTRSKDVSHFLSFDISRDRNTKTFTMNQTLYINDLVETHCFKNSRPVTTQCDSEFKIYATTKHPYCSLIGALLWLSNGTRPDITFAVN